ncbi:enoyl-CoA hydratase-related protein [Bordetella bronchialis]|uniref:Enoyl-CoA hydratase n=1 Tax=Bordetella bronchialis TaxID=463025 RepID=A0A193FHJ4_9BORD|nr:enoyl-CoA hydratase-related protein [Bordetella bronchialis]ANN66666.1 enoyl-CoA hydratase [Bordetella bronchialis]ANN71745.1 enoyl-CoA hydratase [Bordetella bronchialis]
MLHTLEIEHKPQAALVWLSRPDVRNAVDAQMVQELTETYASLGRDSQVRAIVLAARGIAFCAGADDAWTRETAHGGEAAIRADAAACGTMLETIYRCSKPTIVRLHGACMGLGMGLAAACDIAIASSQATFALPETRLGLIPSIIAPYVLRAMSPRDATRWFLTGETFSAAEAWRIGFVHGLSEPDSMDMRIAALVDTFMLTAPDAVAATKVLVQASSGRPVDDTTGGDDLPAGRILASPARAAADGDGGLGGRGPSMLNGMLDG